MRNKELSVVPVATRGRETTTKAVRRFPARQRMRGIAGQLRPYGDVRAGFEPWRRAVLSAWAARESAWIVH
jgi:hypothetical protein